MNSPNSPDTVVTELDCKQCSGKMEKTVLARENSGMTALAVVLAICGIGLLFLFPVGTLVGVILLIAAPRVADRSKKVWSARIVAISLNGIRPGWHVGHWVWMGRHI